MYKKIPISFIIFIACVAIQSQVHAANREELESYGKRISATFNSDVVAYKSVTQTLQAPLQAYLIVFTTSDGSFLANPAAANDKAAYLENTGKRLVWSKKFCTDELKGIMRRTKINIVSGELQNREGKSQFIAMCTAG
jgi:hypothetical protein